MLQGDALEVVIIVINCYYYYFGLCLDALVRPRGPSASPSPPGLKRPRDGCAGTVQGLCCDCGCAVGCAVTVLCLCAAFPAGGGLAKDDRRYLRHHFWFSSPVPHFSVLHPPCGAR